MLAAIATKGVNELTYHRDYAARWVVRLGDGTALSRTRMQAAVEAVWPWIDELFDAQPVELRLTGIAVDPSVLREEVEGVLQRVLVAATLHPPQSLSSVHGTGRTGRDGAHTESFNTLLTELQREARVDPGAIW